MKEQSYSTFIGFGIDAWIPVITALVVLIFGLRLISKELGSSPDKSLSKTRLAELMSEKDEQKSMSFSRAAGAVGAMALTAFFSGIGIWILFELSKLNGNVESKLESIGTYMISGATLFAPYAVNKITEAFKGSE